jgi:23S rRNA pseudouridine2605 synthase
MERLQKVIAQAGVTSRRKAEALIVAGRVKVDGKVVRELGIKVKGDQRIDVDGITISKEDKVYYLLNKPKNCLCTVTDDRERSTVIDIIDTDKRIFPVGRLDFDTTGLLILTNDGEFSNELTHPRYHVPKTYEATINGIMTLDQIKGIQRGLMLEDGLTMPAKLEVKKTNPVKKISALEIRISEGKNRQVKRMFEHFGFEVIRLHRKKIANLDLRGLNQGDYRKLKPFEVVSLKSMANDKKKLN